MQTEIVHIMRSEKFMPPFLDFIDEHLDVSKHTFIFIGKKKYEYGLSIDHPVLWVSKDKDIFRLIDKMNQAKKIIIHGLLSKRFITMLFLQPWLYKKCYWILWGGDFYSPEKQGWMKKRVMQRIRHIICAIKGDYELVKKWYGTTAIHHYGPMYTTNLYKEYEIKEKNHNTVNILVGNSAYPTSNHFEIFEKLEKFKNNDVKIFVPLSYGDSKHAKKVIQIGKEKFGDKFVALTDFMPFEQYLDFLAEIDIAVFNHNRQQAMGNTITLLGLGKKVYIRNDVTPWKMFQEKNIKVYDVNALDLTLIDNETKIHNRKRVKEIFSEENLIKRLKKLF